MSFKNIEIISFVLSFVLSIIVLIAVMVNKTPPSAKAILDVVITFTILMLTFFSLLSLTRIENKIIKYATYLFIPIFIAYRIYFNPDESSIKIFWTSLVVLAIMALILHGILKIVTDTKKEQEG